jgi:hypothetical protein
MQSEHCTFLKGDNSLFYWMLKISYSRYEGERAKFNLDKCVHKMKQSIKHRTFSLLYTHINIYRYIYQV